MPDTVQEGNHEQKYVALVPLMIPSGEPGVASTKFAPGDIFSLDGPEGIRVDRLLQQGAIREYVEKPKAPRRGGDA